jgi:hypothetical protein
LRKSVAQDIGAAQQSLQETQRGLGVMGDIPQNFAEKGIKIGDKIVATNELNRVMEGQKRAIDRFLKVSNMASGMEASTAQQHLTERFNNIRSELIRKGLEFDRKLAQQKATRAERAAAAKNFGAFAGTLVGGMVGGMTGTPQGAMMGASMGGQAGANIGGGMAQ